MGQGAESVPFGYDVEFNPYFDDEKLGFGIWTQSSGVEISVSKMPDSHIKNCIRIVNRERICSTCESDMEKWGVWLDIFNDELFERKKTGKHIRHKFEGERKKRKPSKTIKQVLKNLSPCVKSLEMVCHCGVNYKARVADLKRGWALSCSKSCAATRKTYNKQPAKPMDYNNE